MANQKTPMAFSVKRKTGSKLKFFISVIMLFIGLIGNSVAGGRPNPPGNAGDNIALHKPYTLSPAPNYAACTDVGDATQLTDGTYTSGYFWTQMSTVGWISPTSNPTIKIDLGQTYPIQGISFNTAGYSTAGVYWPTAINLSVSNDDINYYSAGELVGISNNQHGDAPNGTYQIHRYWTANLLSTHGRYVKIEVVRQGQFVFADEIEVYRGANSLLGTNMAAGKTYTMSSPPTYSGCTDAGDATQLTDGIYTSGYFWSQMSTVGWNLPAPDPAITIDLGTIQPIEGISFNTAAGIAGVEWPEAIFVLVSDDGTNYYNAGEIITLSSEHGLPSDSGYLIRSYWTDRLATHGHYVKIMPVKSGCFLFVDEIEVYQGNSGMMTQPSRGTSVTDMTAYLKSGRTNAGIARRIVLDAQDVQTQTDNQTGIAQTVRDQIKTALTTSINEAMYLSPVDPVTFQAILPLNSSHARVFNALAMLWRAQGRSNLTGWQTGPLDPLNLTQTPGTSLTGVSVAMLQGEYRSAAFNISNPTNSDVAASLNIQGLTGGTNPSYIKAYEVAWTGFAKPMVNALPEAGTNSGAYIINIPSGMTRQVWLTFNPVSVDPGTYNGTIVVNGGTAGTVNVPIQFRLLELAFPAKPALSLGGFDYTDGNNLTAQIKTPFITYLREHFVDTTWGTANAMPSPAAYAAFDAWAQLWPGVRNYRIFLNAGNTFNGCTAGTPQFNSSVATWINAYAAHWQGMGLNLSQIGLHFVDEPQTQSAVDTISYWAAAVKAAQPDIKVWTDPLFADPTVTAAATLFAACDILCPNRPDFIAANETFRNVYRTQRDTYNKTLNFYSCEGPAKQLDPYSYYRLQAWTCWAEKATAMHYWSFVDIGGGTSWNEYSTSNAQYCPFYINTSSITTGKQMEAIREGVEDYEILNMLKKRITYWEGQPNPPDLSYARGLRDNAASVVLNATGAGSINWADAKDRTIADQKRIEILNELETLGPQTGNNIALNCTYTMSPSPNYVYCTDAGDATQLTDGTYTSGYFWVQSSTVGWESPSSNPVIIIDLNAVQSIKGISFNTAAGVGGVYWPNAINVSFSNDGVTYGNAYELTSLSNTENGSPPPYGTYSLWRYRTSSLNVHGRFVKLEVIGSPFIFADEIEVYKK